MGLLSGIASNIEEEKKKNDRRVEYDGSEGGKARKLVFICVGFSELLLA